ncbi:MAG: carboxypeptidase-like regulatory domain-containing protein, partial [Muribaculaceae bacterium]|nr:carboxypeptidase-like regulatory domain-containing protein [Muribaculaceae bacterium]
MKKILLNTIILVYSTSWAFGATITGRVTDSADHSPLPFCSVIFSPGNFQCVTDAEGHYAITLNNGEYIVNAEYLGYNPYKNNFKVNKEGVKVDIS